MHAFHTVHFGKGIVMVKKIKTTKKPVKKKPVKSVRNPNFPNRDVTALKSSLAKTVTKIIQDNDWTCKKAAELIGSTRAHISNLKHGKIRSFSIDRLVAYLVLLEHNVELQISPTPQSRVRKPKDVKRLKRGKFSFLSKLKK